MNQINIIYCRDKIFVIWRDSYSVTWKPYNCINWWYNYCTCCIIWI